MTNEENIVLQSHKERLARDLGTIEGLSALISEAPATKDGSIEANAMLVLRPAIKEIAERLSYFVRYEFGKRGGAE